MQQPKTLVKIFDHCPCYFPTLLLTRVDNREEDCSEIVSGLELDTYKNEAEYRIIGGV